MDEPPSGQGVATLVAVRASAHEGFDRVVFEFAEEDVLPGHHLEYVDRPLRHCGSGEPEPVAGDGWLQVRLEPARAHTDEGRPTLPFRESFPRLPVLLELQSLCDFEAVVTWALGLRSPNRYRLMKLDEPSRLVVDVAH